MGRHRVRQKLLDKISAEKQSREAKKEQKEEAHVKFEARREQNRRRQVYERRRCTRQMSSHVWEKDDRTTPHPLIVVKQWIFEHTLEDNSIIVENFSRKNCGKRDHCDGGIVSYDIKFIGRNIMNYFGKGKMEVEIEVKGIPKGFFVVLCSVQEEFISQDPHISLLPHDCSENDFILLSVCASNMTSIDHISVNDWDNNAEFLRLCKTKTSTVKNGTNHHYGSFGYCFSFGLRNNYGLDTSGRYSYTSYANDEDIELQPVKQYLSKNLLLVYHTFDKIIAGISGKLQDIGKTLKFLSNNHEMLDIGENDSYASPLTVHININAGTQDLHCEKDVSYTIIHVPLQISVEPYIIFQFQINESVAINLKCDPGCCFAYTAYCMTHRQLGVHGDNCMNISTYIGKRVFNSFKQSFCRKREKDYVKMKSWMTFS
jgi:hypothetical protein